MNRQPASGRAERLLALDAFVLQSSLDNRRALSLSASEWLVFLVITTAAVQRVLRSNPPDPRLLGIAPIPSELLGATSRRRIAEVCGLPLETVRRKVARLVAGGLVREDDEGLRGQRGLLASMAASGHLNATLQNFLAVFGPTGAEALPHGRPRLVAYHFANTDLDLHLSLRRQYRFPPAVLELLLLLLDMEHPLSQRHAARRLGLPRETCRRYLAQLSAAMLVDHGPNGVSVSAAAREAHARHAEAAERLRRASALRRTLCAPASPAPGPG